MSLNHAVNGCEWQPTKSNLSTNSRPIDLMLTRLSGVRQTRTDRWQARCPAHDDRSPSLSISETPEGTVLIKCWAGCSVSDIVAALGLELRDLFPPNFDCTGHQASKPSRYSPTEVVKTVITEATILVLGYRTVQRGDTLKLTDQARVELAINAIETCREVVSCR